MLGVTKKSTIGNVKEVKEKSQIESGGKLNGIEIYVCVLDGELCSGSDEWIIRWVDGSIAWSRQY